jgi:hypothetical protein
MGYPGKKLRKRQKFERKLIREMEWHERSSQIKVEK